MIWALLWIACRPSLDKSDSAETAADSVPVAVTPQVRIVAPQEGAALSGGDVEVILDLQDFRLEPPGGASLMPLPLPLLAIPSAWAHGDLSDPAGYVRCLLDGTEVALMTSEIVALEGVEPGDHRLEVALYWAVDGDAFYPPIEDSVSFTVAAR